MLLRQTTATARLHNYFLTRRHPPVVPAPSPLLILPPPPPLASTASLGLLSGWLSCQFFLMLPRPICLHFLPRRCLLFCHSRASCWAVCYVASPHAATSLASASPHAITSCSPTLTPLVWLVVASILLMPPHPICRLHHLEGWAQAADHLGPPPSPLAMLLPLVLPLSRLLSGWLLRCLSSRHRDPCQRLCLLPRD